jgi:hypothetical protein
METMKALSSDPRPAIRRPRRGDHPTHSMEDAVAIMTGAKTVPEDEQTLG